MSYYKTNHPTVIQAMADFRASRDELIAKSKVFADAWGGKPVILRDMHCVWLAGLTFSPRKDKPMWTCPDRQHSVQAPRKACLPKDQKEQGLAVYKKWHEEFPTDRISLKFIYESFGTDWGNLLFAGIGYFEGVDGFVYVETSAKLADHMAEILGSEYQAAQAALREKAA